MSRVSKTQIVFPRVSNHDGPAKTLVKNDYLDASFEENNPIFNSLRYGFSDESAYKKDNLKTMISLDPPIVSTQETRNSQRFRSNFKRPDDITRKLINRRRG